MNLHTEATMPACFLLVLLWPYLTVASSSDQGCARGVSYESNPQCYTRVVIVGAGMSGLATARTLLDNWGAESDESVPMGGLHIDVLEARNRVGGRMWTKDGDSSSLVTSPMGAEVDLGAGFIHRSTEEDPIEQIANLLESKHNHTADIFLTDDTEVSYYECGADAVSASAAVGFTCPADPRREHCVPVHGCEALNDAEAEIARAAFSKLHRQVISTTCRR
eukprot:SAG11_NODE_225_length_12064_cov_7.850815_10_plen_221_part_00